MCTYDPDAVVLTIDTTSFSGDFEREMCGHITGQFGECHVGECEAEVARESIQHLDWLDGHIRQISDDNDCKRPCSIWLSALSAEKDSRREYNSVGLFFDEVPPTEVLAELLERAQAYCADNALEYRGYRILTPTYATVPVVQVTGHQLLTE